MQIMNKFLLTITSWILFASRALANDGEAEFTDISEADLVGPSVGLLIIGVAIVIAWFIRKGSKK